MTWLQQIPSDITYYHVIGDETLESDFVFDEAHKILWVKVKDDYNSLPKKVIRAYEAIDKTFQFKYIFKTDDDQILVNPHFLDIIRNITSSPLKEKVHYGGFTVNIENHFSNYHRIHPELPAYLPMKKTIYCSGRFYFLSKEAVTHLLGKKESIEGEYFEDYAMGLYLDACYKENILHLHTNQYFTDIERSNFSKWVEEGRL